MKQTNETRPIELDRESGIAKIAFSEITVVELLLLRNVIVDGDKEAVICNFSENMDQVMMLTMRAKEKRGF